MKLLTLQKVVNAHSRGISGAAGRGIRLFVRKVGSTLGQVIGHALLAALLGSAGVAPLGAQVAPEDALVVRKLKFEGNESISAERIAASIETTESAWLATGPLRFLGLGEKRYFNERAFKADVLRIGVLYRLSGFPNVAVDTLVQRTDQNVRITFKITEGEPIRVSTLDVTGLDSLEAHQPERLTDDLPLFEGDIFDRSLMQASADSIVRRLKDEGYPSADVLVSYVVRTAELSAAVTLDAVPGTRARFGDVRVIGNKRVRESTVISLMTARPGHYFAQSDLFRSQRVLYASDLFRLTAVNIDTTRFVPGSDNVPLVVQVLESPPRRARASAGYATNDCFRGSMGITFRNFLGNGRLLDLTGRISKVGVGEPFDAGFENSICSPLAEDTLGSRLVNFGLNASLRRPAFLSPNNTLIFSAFGERRSEFKVYRRREVGVSVSLNRETPVRRLPVALTYTLLYGKTTASPFSYCAFFNSCEPADIEFLGSTQRLGMLKGTATVPRANNPLDPTRGYIASAELSFASRFIGSSSQQQFLRALADYAWYRPVARDVVFSWRVRGGMIFSPVRLSGSDVPFVPPEHRFYGGGPNDVRGYQRNQLGPVVYYTTRDAVGGESKPGRDSALVRIAPVGGNTQAVANVELRFPSPIFSSRLRLATFVDAGSVWQRGLSDIDFRVTPGAGIRVSTPLGPARFDVAYNPLGLQSGPLYIVEPDNSLTLDTARSPYRLENRSKFTFHFAVGQPF